ncbi:MAG: I78 family peptidase inhibitor [Pseudomonadota bacterium]|nr:I78 family peptidase inhibitor [Pseudomonadota bacterium]
MKKSVLVIVAGLAVAACSTPADRRAPSGTGDAAATRPAPSPCGAAQMGYLVGQQVEEVDLRTLSGNVRLIYPDTPVTEDYRPGRLNLDLDASGVILRPWCG